MKARRDFKVTECGQVPQDSHVKIEFNGKGLFELSVNLGLGLWGVVATCPSAKRLSDWAFDNGAQSVKHAYDLKLSDGEA